MHPLKVSSAKHEFYASKTMSKGKETSKCIVYYIVSDILAWHY